MDPIGHCHRCVIAAGCKGECQCPADGMPPVEHVAAGYCPLRLFGEGARPDGWPETKEDAARVLAERRAAADDRRLGRPVPRDQWPRVARVLARRRREGEAGVGDTAARLLHRMGADGLAWLYEKATGKDCGCSDRQERLNRMYPY